MSLLHPQSEDGYPDNCITVDDAVAAIRKIFAHPSHRITAFEIKTITDKGGTLRLAFDRTKVGQTPSIEATPLKEGP